MAAAKRSVIETGWLPESEAQRIEISHVVPVMRSEDAKEGMRAFASNRGTLAPIVRDYALPISQAVCAHRAGNHAEAVALMRPALGGMWRLGGSHAQQDVLEQVFLDAAARAGQTDDVRLVLERAAGRRAIPLERMVGWHEAAHQFSL